MALASTPCLPFKPKLLVMRVISTLATMVGENRAEGGSSIWITR